MPQDYLVLFAQAHNDFRLPELNSVSELYEFKYTLSHAQSDPCRPFMVIRLELEEHARLLARRCILIKAIYEYYGHANRANRALWERYIPDTSFKFVVTAFNHSIPQDRQKEVIENFSYMDFLGKIDMREPDIVLGCFEEYPDKQGAPRTKLEGDGSFLQVYFGRLIEEGSARQLISRFDVKKRVYYGNTSMESEISLLMTNQTLAAPGKLIYDPFMGTGSMAYPAAHFGAFIFGSDIDGRQMRGKGKPPGVIRAAIQYGISSRILDICTFDVTQSPWRLGELFDAIVTDPPIETALDGVRAGAKRLGRKRKLSPARYATYMEHQKSPRPDDQPYIPPTKPYELSTLVADLVILARYLLKPNGRLVFFLPTVVANSLQDFGSWGRRLVTIKKATTAKYSSPSFAADDIVVGEHIPAHRDFREKYFRGFKKDD
ncbi:tRNA guanosine-2'-O-methyltransferase [Amanita rubescens]|nr:tRNA guanosine-2'-O-methyltransferase [Amanita rubescens]